MRLDGLSEWRNQCAAAIQEVDPEKLLSRICGAKMAIRERIEEMDGHGNSAERIALKRAMSLLSRLQGLYFHDFSRPA